jgi:hypothetical protein
LELNKANAMTDESENTIDGIILGRCTYMQQGHCAAQQQQDTSLAVHYVLVMGHLPLKTS